MRPGSVDDAVSFVQKLSEEKGALVLVAIDGHSAAGKSTLARTLQNTLENVQLVSGDDFYRVMPERERFRLDAPAGYRRYYDWERLGQVLDPLAALEKAHYRAYNWEAGVLGDWRVIHPYGTIVVEGVFSARPELRGYYDAIFLVETPQRVREHRQKRRADAPEAWLERWEAAEKHYLENSGLHTYADLIVRAE